jgi:hypothetical protein
MSEFKVGDLVSSVAGFNKNKIGIVISIEECSWYVVCFIGDNQKWYVTSSYLRKILKRKRKMS